MSSEACLIDLNPPQREAVLHTEGPLLILAGAGSGKTRVITHRIAYLIGECHIRPWNVLAVTFTNKAAEEMRERVARLLGAEGVNVWVGTFHATCVKILRKNAQHLDLRSSFVIYDEGDQLALLRGCLKELDLGERVIHPRVVRAKISRAKNDLLTPAGFASQAADYLEERVARIYYRYQAALQRNGALDFDDLLMETVRLFVERPLILSAYQELWRYLMVDEYQDTNHAQYRLIRLLAERHQNLAVVGDDDQSIYRWRGADLANILDFERDYPSCKVIRLEQNYRSTQRILEAASSVIARNRGRKVKRLWTENEVGELVGFCHARDEGDEATFIMETIRHLAVQEGYDFDDFAVFYRVNAQSRVLEDALRRAVVPYAIVGGLRFYERKEIRDLVAYLRLIANPADSVSFLRVVNVPARGIGRGTLDRVSELAAARGLSLWEACREIEKEGFLAARQMKALLEFQALIERFIARLHETPVPDLVSVLLQETGYSAELEQEGTPEALSRIENLQELISAALDFVQRSEDTTLQAFLDMVALLTNVDEGMRDTRGRVTLMTLHMAKGLEFPVVFIAGMEEGVFPHGRAYTDPEELEEERRLCYVGVTRAKKRLFLTAAVQRRLYGGESFNLPSRFLEEITPHLLERIEAPSPSYATSLEGYGASVLRYEVEADQTPFVDFYQPGIQVRHPEWGVGRIRERMGNGDEMKVVVTFPGIGTKKLKVKYAQLTRA
ncbi:MAG: UvrD-helicase domain-containing protein [candidate division NC10 bacterium]|nr:UvrD-helicase domain-containing protein [candidate division NC10 bacterium]